MRYKITDQNRLHFLTFTMVDWVDLFTRQVYCEMVLDSLRFCQKEKELGVFAYVIMPSHLHLLLQTENPKGLSYIIQNFKSFTAKQILEYLQNKDKPESRRDWLLNRFAFNARKNKTNSGFQIWQRDNHPVILYSPRAIRTNLAYIHNNPVKARIVNQADHYCYSSASNYVSGKGLLEVSILEDIWDDTGYIDMGY